MAAAPPSAARPTCNGCSTCARSPMPCSSAPGRCAPRATPGSCARGAARAAACGGLAEDPLAVILSRRFDIPWEAGLFQAPEQPVLIYTGADAGDPADVPAPVEVVRLEVPGLTAMLADLSARGVRKLLSEGGPTMHGALWAAGVVDELNVTITPLITGDADEPNIVEGGRLPADVELELLRGRARRVGALPAVRSRVMRIEGSSALVAGGASGLGAATARRLRAAGAEITIADLNAEKGAALAEELGRASSSATSRTPSRSPTPSRPPARCGSRSAARASAGPRRRPAGAGRTRSTRSRPSCA